MKFVLMRTFSSLTSKTKPRFSLQNNSKNKKKLKEKVKKNRKIEKSFQNVPWQPNILKCMAIMKLKLTNETMVCGSKNAIKPMRQSSAEVTMPTYTSP